MHASAGGGFHTSLASWPHPSNRSRRSGFSLVEVTLSIGVIAFAFVALLGLLPAGLSSFRAAIDTSNEARIVQSLVGKVQMTDFNEIPHLDYGVSEEVYYFDEEGSPTDTSKDPVNELKDSRLYAAKLFVRPASEKDPDDPTRNLNFSVDVIIVFANLASSGKAQFDLLNTKTDLDVLMRGKGRVDVRIRPVLISKMDGYRP